MKPARPFPAPAACAWRAVALAVVAWGIVVPLGQASGLLRLNEIVAVNQSGAQDGSGKRPDWLEIYNPTTAPVSLAGWALSDDPGRPRRWVFQNGVVPAGGYLVVYASGENRQPTVHAAREPDQVPGLGRWHRADSIDPARPDLVRRSGNAAFVRSWPDVRGIGTALVQATAGRQPQWVGGAQPAVRFDGIDDLLLVGRPDATNEFTLVLVARPSAAQENDEPSVAGVGGTSGQRWLLGAAHGGDLDAGVGVSLGTNGASVYEHGSGHMPARVVRVAEFGQNPVLLTLRYTAGQPSLGVHGGPNATAPSSQRRYYTSPVELGSGAYGAFAGEVFEWVLFRRALDDAEQRAVELALAIRHGIALSDEWHTDFRLDGQGETLELSDPSGAVVDRVSFPALPADIAWGRSVADPATWLFHARPTPGAANHSPAAHRWLAPPQFSQPGGFHATPFDLVLQADAPGSEIHYTLDGTEPTPDSPIYASSLRIADRSAAPNVLSLIPTGGGWQPPARAVFKGTVVRARAFAPDALPSPSVTATYFVHASGRARYALPVVALTVAPPDFFDAERGIYVPGQAPGGNFAQSGDAWERPAFVEFFETNGVRAFAARTGVRIHGNTSFQFPIKALRLHALNQGGTGPFRHRIFPEADVDRFNRLLLRPSGHDFNLTLMRDGVMQSLGADLGLDTQRYRPAVLFLNGEYWGIHNLQEAFEKDYFPAHHPGVDADALDYLEGYAPSPFVYEGSADAYLQLVRYLTDHGADSAADLAWVGDRMELANFRDYKIAEIFHYRWDIGNHRFWRPASPGGRFRWILFDCDVGFGGFWSEPNAWSFNMLRAVLEPSGSLHGHNSEATVFLLRALLGNASFRDDFILRFADVLNGPFDSGRIVDRIDRKAAEIAPLISEHTERWRQPGSVREWQNQVEALRVFARRRPAAVRTHLASQFGLGGWARLILSVESPLAGTIRCHSLEGLARSNAWSGLYPLRVPIEISAVPEPGFTFAGWRELPGITTPTLRLALQAETTLTAVFQSNASPRLTWSASPSDGRMEWVAQMIDARGMVLETSTDLSAWTALRTLTPDGLGEARVPVETAGVHRFFRLRSLP